jgi:hypothetical protein
MAAAWSANDWRIDLARDGGRHGWKTLVARPRARSRFDLVPLGEGPRRSYPLIDAVAEAEVEDLGAGTVTVRLRTAGWSAVKDVDVAAGGTGTVDFTVPD